MQRNRVITAIATASVLLLASAGTVFAMQTNGQGNFLMQTSGQNHDDGNGNDFAPLPTGYTVQPLAGELDVPVALDCELPPGVVSTALQASQGGTLEDAQIDFDDVVTVYEIGATGRHGRELEVDVFSDGNLEEIEIVLSERRAARIPSEVTESLEPSVPGLRDRPDREEHQAGRQRTVAQLLRVRWRVGRGQESRRRDQPARHGLHR